MSPFLDEYRRFLRSRWTRRGQILCRYAMGGGLVFFAFDLAGSPLPAARVAALRLPWILIPALGWLVIRLAPAWRLAPALVVAGSLAFTWGNDWTSCALGLAGTVVQTLEVAACVVTAATFLPITLRGRVAVFGLMLLGHLTLDLAWPQPRPLADRLWAEAGLLAFVIVETVVYESLSRSQQRGFRLRVELERTIADLEESRRRAAEAVAAVAHLAAGVAHEVNNPLAAVKVNVRWLGERVQSGGEATGAGAEVDEVMEDALEAIARITRIVAELKRRAEEHER
jgi:signal transduction histidine kinase